VLTLAALVYAMDLTVLNLAIPRISAELRPSSAQLLWIIDIYGFLVAGLLITMGTLGDRIGRRKLLLGGAAGFSRRCSRPSRRAPRCSSRAGPSWASPGRRLHPRPCR
jgi:MFS family permease